MPDQQQPTNLDLLNALNAKHDENKERFDHVERRLQDLRSGFPGDDPGGHRRYHDELIAQAAARTMFWRGLLAKLIEKGIWAALLGLAASVVFYFRNGPK